MSIYWKRTADEYPDGGYGPDWFMAFDPEVRFPRFHMETGDETTGNVHRIERSPDRGRTSIRTLAMVDDRLSAWAALWWPADEWNRTDQRRGRPARH
ncbi:hypothetical protein [Microvirga sp. CF3016]|uniref:hypothetical protein n=1 Tax=Microvirga sp. CF3016 TaxID=3110181 RepID=UPI002E77426D|nr:hypothetical protein [Microvirga sp. CF3016]MEE1611121.1 hypothetical protein [Microvirga sp. CF3016]